MVVVGCTATVSSNFGGSMTITACNNANLLPSMFVRRYRYTIQKKKGTGLKPSMLPFCRRPKNKMSGGAITSREREARFFGGCRGVAARATRLLAPSRPDYLTGQTNTYSNPRAYVDDTSVTCRLLPHMHATIGWTLTVKKNEAVRKLDRKQLSSVPRSCVASLQVQQRRQS